MAVDLRIIPLFKGVEEDALRALAGRAVITVLPANALVFKEGDLQDSVYVILSGRVKVFLHDEHGKEIVLSTKGPGEYFGEMMLDDRPRSASVMTLEPAELAVLSREQFTTFLRQHPDVALQLIRDLIRLSRGMNTRTRESFRKHLEELETAKAAELASASRWQVAKWVIAGVAVLLLALHFAQF